MTMPAEPSTPTTELVGQSQPQTPTGVPSGNQPKPAKPSVTPDVSAKPPPDDTDLPAPEGPGVVKLTTQQLTERLSRAANSQLRKIFGTDNHEEITARWQKAQEYEKQQETERRKSLSEQERLKEDLRLEREASLRLKGKMQTLQRDRAMRAQDAHIAGIGAQYIKSEDLKDVIYIFGRYVRELSSAQRDKIDDKAVAKWFADYATKKPAFARPGVVKAARPKQPLTNGAGGQRPNGSPPPPQSGIEPQEKSFAPGRSNSMSSREARQEAAKRGISW